jgi:2-succinyl-6-hydroxy-2,4-cyclohexadiene-1-carboxylate synthase
VLQTVVLLHGFGGTHRAWDDVIARLDAERYRALALDLPGHGRHAEAPPPITFAACVEHVLQQAPERFVLCGYSMGGRIAMQVALVAPERLEGLVLVACSPGIENPRERAARRASDAELSARLESEPYEEFIERWRAQALFAQDPPHVGELAREDQRRNDPHALAEALRGIGTGEMEPIWSRLPEIQTPTLIMAGERDEKFRAIGQRMATLLPQAQLIEAPGGHVLPLENADAVSRALESLPSKRDP